MYLIVYAIKHMLNDDDGEDDDDDGDKDDDINDKCDDDDGEDAYYVDYDK